MNIDTSRMRMLRNKNTPTSLSSELNILNDLVTPAIPDVAPNAATTGDPVFNIPWSFLGLPTLSLPTGFVDALPFAIQLTAARDCEDDLFRAAIHAEKKIGFQRRLPPVPR